MPRQANNFVSLQISVLYIFIKYLVERLSFVWAKVKKRRQKVMLEVPQKPWPVAFAVQRPSGLEYVLAESHLLSRGFSKYSSCFPWKSHFSVLLLLQWSFEHHIDCHAGNFPVGPLHNSPLAERSTKNFELNAYCDRHCAKPLVSVTSLNPPNSQ